MQRLGNYPYQTILYALTFQDVLESNIMMKRITVVKSTANKSSCNIFGNGKSRIPANTTKVTNMIKATIISL